MEIVQSFSPLPNLTLNFWPQNQLRFSSGHGQYMSQVSSLYVKSTVNEVIVWKPLFHRQPAMLKPVYSKQLRGEHVACGSFDGKMRLHVPESAPGLMRDTRGFIRTWNTKQLMHCHCGTNKRAPWWTFMDPCKPEARPGAREESASPAWLAAPAMNARDTTKVYIWRPGTGCGLLKASAHSFKRVTSQLLKLSFSLYAPITSDECHAWFHLNAASPAARNMEQVNITKNLVHGRIRTTNTARLTAGLAAFKWNQAWHLSEVIGA